MSILTTFIKRFTAPALPQPPQEFDQKYFDKFNSVLRIYFNQLDQLLGQLVSGTTTVPISIGGTNVDAFGRVRSSEPVTIFDSQNRYEVNEYFDTALTGGGTTTYLPNESTVRFNVGTASGDAVVRQTYRSFIYQPGKSLLTMSTLVMNAPKANLRQRVGYFSTQNGAYLEQDGLTTYIVMRSYVTGAVVNNRVAQADWNGDKLNGTGVSGVTLDISQSQIFWQDFEWLGVGSVRCGFIIDGQYIVAHTFKNANQNNSVYMTTAILPIRYELENTAATASASTLKQICSTVISEGGYEKKVILNTSTMTAINTAISTTFVPLVSIRLAPGRDGAVIIPDGYSVLPISTTATTFEVVLVKNATLTGPTSWVTTASTNVQADIASTGYTGGLVVEAIFVSASNNNRSTVQSGVAYNFDLQLGSSLAGVSDIYTIAIKTFSGTQSAIGSLSFYDLT
jgi:hypothetical protein